MAYRDIDFILSYDIKIPNIYTMSINFPVQSNHLRIVFVGSFFKESFPDIATASPCFLTSGNQQYVTEYLDKR